MPAPPPPPPGVLGTSAQELFLSELAALDTPELLALCLRSRRDPHRLSQYLALFRSRSGSRAQLAACMVCFDLARQGSEVAQRELLVLAPTILGLARDQGVVDGLLAGDAYLRDIWRDCHQALQGSDPRELAGPQLEESVELAGEIDLLDGDEFEVVFDDEVVLAERQQQEFSKIVADYLDYSPEYDQWGSGNGFATEDSVDLARLTAFVAEAGSRSRYVPVARGMLSLGNLFLGMHLRRHTIFGRPNRRRVAALQAGLEAFDTDSQALAFAAALFESEGLQVIERLDKVLELLMDFLAWCAQSGTDPRAAKSAADYLALDREPPALLRGEDENRRRR